jgi:hypothetical protein
MTNVAAYLEEFVKRSLVELQQKSLGQIQLETAMVWYGRAVAASRLGKSADAIEYAHESIEHAALSGALNVLQDIRAALVQNGIAL